MEIALVLLAVVVVVGVWGVSTYNRLVAMSKRAEEGWSGILVQLKRRHDLVPNLARLIQSYASHEKEVFEKVTSARMPNAKAPSAEFAAAEGAFGQSIGRLLAIAENYPELKANRNYTDLHESLTKLEDEIQMSRRYYNGVVRDYNTVIDSFPSLIVARAGNFRARAFFDLASPEEADNPEIFVS